ncbi:AI-2E family transporter [Pontibacter chitinilyticus]|uniref:AI-2E family transporter n=1 Tax=Pontibacter chitinilyticus TaxID=2674989 RepID=UPI0032194203
MTDTLHATNSGKPPEKDTFSHKVLKAFGIVIGGLLVLALFYYTFNSVLLLLFASVLIAVFFRGTAGALSRHSGMSHKLSMAIVIVGVLGISVLAWWWLAPQVSEQINSLSNQLPQAIDRFKSQLTEYTWGQKLVDEVPTPSSFLSRNDGWMQKSLGILSTTFGVLANLYIIIFVAIFLTAGPEMYRTGIVMLFPIPHRAEARHVLDKLGSTLYKWILGKLFSMAVVGILTVVGLLLLGVPMAMALGVIAGLLSFIPNFGPILALAPAVLIALLQGPDQALYVVLLYIGIQAVESNLLTPMVQRKMIAIPPALVITGQLLLAVFSGILGLILATPIIAVVIVLVKLLYVRDVLGDQQVKVE